MTFIKKILLGGAFATVVVPTTILMVSCSTSSNDTFDLGISEKTEAYYGQKLQEKLASDTDKSIVQRKTVLITAGGRVDDKSFNESAWGAIQLYSQQVNNTSRDHFNFEQTTNDTELDALYTKTIDQGFKTLVLTGFQQERTFKAWLDKSGNRAKFENSKAIVIGVDWDGSSFIPQGQFLGLGFASHEASWIVGQAASEYLHAKGLPPHLNTFGGGDSDGVTDFNNGFLQGMLDWNEANPDKLVKFYSGNNETNQIVLDTGFLETTQARNTINSIVGTTANSPRIILPVAGSLSNIALDSIKDKRSGQLLIGVDSNQALAFPNDKSIFFSSVEKKVAVGIYKAMVLLAGIPLDLEENGNSDLGFQGDFVAVGSEGIAKNAYVKYGFDKGLVGFSNSTLAGDDADIANKALDNAYKRFKDKKPTFESMEVASENKRILEGIIAKINAS
ncbi:MAG: BMP family ABC transporter substrate-binding protein [Metamycoplasmataceae bacterium]